VLPLEFYELQLCRDFVHNVTEACRVLMWMIGVVKGRKSRRERRAFKERLMKNRLPSPPRWDIHYDDDDYDSETDFCL